MKIKEIQATNFKSFSNLNIKDFLPLNFIFGFNNSGKSNLLKLIEAIFSRKIDIDRLTYINKEGVSEERSEKKKGNFWEGIIENHGYIFRFGNAEKDITFHVILELHQEEVVSLSIHKELVSNKLISTAETHEITISGRIVGIGQKDARQELDKVVLDDKTIYNKSDSPSSTINVFELLSIMNDSVLFIDYDRYFKTEAEDKSINELLPANFRNWLFNLSLANNRKDFNDLLQAVREFKISSTDSRFNNNEKSSPFNKNFEYRFGRNDQLIEVYFKNDYGEMPLSSFGTGVQQIVYLLFKIFEYKPKILLIEEIELNLSPKYQDILIKYFDTLIAKNGFLQQAFITSHSPLHCYRSQDRSFRAIINNAGETTFDKFILDEKENRKLKAAHDFLIKSVYGMQVVKKKP